jgi:ABC-2 type transport system permease protein
LGRTLTIAKREFAAYWNSPIAYILVIAFLVISGFLFFSQVFLGRQASMRAFFDFMPLLFMFLSPAMTMRLLAEERGSGSIELLITLPVRDSEVVVGKFLAAVGLLLSMLVFTLAYAFTVRYFGHMDWGAVVGGYVGLILMASAYLSIGIAASAFTKNQITAFIAAFFVCFFFWAFDKTLAFMPDKLAPLIQFISFGSHFQSIERGVLDSRDILYYASFIALSLLISVQSLESRRWR